MSHDIPFFSDLSVEAIPAVQRLYDEAQEAGYSLPVAYSNLVSRLNASGVTPPARALVKRWLAAVEIGMAVRPEMPAGAGDVKSIPAQTTTEIISAAYFGNLPEVAWPALAAMWSAVEAATDTPNEEAADERTFDDFFGAMREIGFPEPTWKAFVSHARAIRAGQVERPARQIVEELLQEPAPTDRAIAEDRPEPRKRRAKADIMVEHPETGMPVRPEVVAEIDEETRAIVGADVELLELGGEVADTAGFVALTPNSYREFVQGGAMSDPVPGFPPTTAIEFLGEKEAEADIVGKLRSVRDDLVAAACAALQVNMHRRAKQIVAGQLRAMADEMEAGAA